MKPAAALARVALCLAFVATPAAAQSDKIAELKEKATKISGHVKAQFKLGYMYFYGYGTAQDKAEGQKWWRLAFEQYRLAAEQGDAEAQNQLGGMYYFGFGVTEDGTEAKKWYRLAAEQGESTVYYFDYGIMHDRTEGQKWCRLAFEQYRLAAEQGDAEAQKKWCRLAFEQYRLAAEQGDAEAQYRLGEMYYYGTGVAEDAMEAEKWYRLAAGDEERAEARYQLGNIDGNGNESKRP